MLAGDEVHLGVGGRRREHAALGHVRLQVALRLGEALQPLQRGVRARRRAEHGDVVSR